MRSGGTSARRRPRRPTRTFVSLTGPAGNLGDALIRRGTLDWARGTSDELVAYTGAAPDVWLQQLGVPSDAILLRDKRSVPRWLWLIVTAPSRPVLVLEAGEVPLDRGNGQRELVFLAETVIVRLKRGIVVRLPRGIRAPTNPAAWLHARAAHLSQIALWRDDASAAVAGGGRVAPDIGFAAGVRTGRPWDERDELIVSLRGARPHPDDAWVEAVRATAAAEGLRIRTVVQVREDEPRARTRRPARRCLRAVGRHRLPGRQAHHVRCHPGRGRWHQSRPCRGKRGAQLGVRQWGQSVATCQSTRTANHE